MAASTLIRVQKHVEFEYDDEKIHSSRYEQQILVFSTHGRLFLTYTRHKTKNHRSGQLEKLLHSFLAQSLHFDVHNNNNFRFNSGGAFGSVGRGFSVESCWKPMNGHKHRFSQQKNLPPVRRYNGIASTREIHCIWAPMAALYSPESKVTADCMLVEVWVLPVVAGFDNSETFRRSGGNKNSICTKPARHVGALGAVTVRFEHLQLFSCNGSHTVLPLEYLVVANLKNIIKVIQNKKVQIANTRKYC